MQNRHAVFIMKFGKSYTSALLPTGLKRGGVGECFDTCAVIASKNPNLKYVEGLARPAHEDKWFLHAWITDEDGLCAYDPTWLAIDNKTGKEIPVPCEYVGIEMDIHAVAAFMTATGYQGIIVNYNRNPALAGVAMESQL